MERKGRRVGVGKQVESQADCPGGGKMDLVVFLARAPAGHSTISSAG